MCSYLLLCLQILVVISITNTSCYPEEVLGQLSESDENFIDHSQEHLSTGTYEKDENTYEKGLGSHEKDENTYEKGLGSHEKNQNTSEKGKFRFEGKYVHTKKYKKDDDVIVPLNETTPQPTKHEARRLNSMEELATSTLINYPYAVSVQRKGAHYTTGALLNKRWILTSAREYYNVRESLKLIKARLGSVDCKKGGTTVAIRRIEIHPQYVHNEPNFDLGLLQIAEPISLTDFILPIRLSQNKKKIISAKFLTAYWPSLIIKGQPLPSTALERVKKNSMRVSTQKLIPKKECHASLMNYTKIYHSTLCLKPIVTHHSICKPDAGAPLVAEDGLWGITSGWVSKNCTQNPSPTVFTRLSEPRVKQWLDYQMQEPLVRKSKLSTTTSQPG